LGKLKQELAQKLGGEKDGPDSDGGLVGFEIFFGDEADEDNSNE